MQYLLHKNRNSLNQKVNMMKIMNINIYCVPQEGGISIDIEYKTRAVEFWRCGKAKRRSLESVQNRFTMVKSIKQLERWEASVDRGGTNMDKSTYVTEYVLVRFKEGLNCGNIIHEVDLRRWALQAKDEIQYRSFNASHWWIWHFT